MLRQVARFVSVRRLPPPVTCSPPPTLIRIGVTIARRLLVLHWWRPPLWPCPWARQCPCRTASPPPAPDLLGAPEMIAATPRQPPNSASQPLPSTATRRCGGAPAAASRCSPIRHALPLPPSTTVALPAALHHHYHRHRRRWAGATGRQIEFLSFKSMLKCFKWDLSHPKKIQARTTPTVHSSDQPVPCVAPDLHLRLKHIRQVRFLSSDREFASTKKIFEALL
jgi:hypothetical protein